MQTWQQFLLEQDFRFEAEHPSLAMAPASSESHDTKGKSTISPLTDLGLICFQGEEAAKFLHSQLSNDVEHLGTEEARLAAYCSPKGRMLASFLMWREEDAIYLELPREIQPAVQKRLQMFIMRAKAKASDVSETRVVLGLTGDAAAAALAPWCKSLPTSVYARTDATGGSVIRVADAFGAPRYQWITTLEQAIQAWPEFVRTLTPTGTSQWRLGDIVAGIPQIVAATQESFVPQMINFEVIGGVNFKKGCYPGQEIVARSQYLGKLKRRMSLALVDASAGTVPVAGMEVFAMNDPEQPCGIVVNAEPSKPDEYALLVELKTAAIEAGSIHLGAATGPSLRIQALPYAIPDAV